ncbi:MAG: protein kinase [Alphaproteobacteria bacterium]|nr:protein kinase [Alphaproteobacteria bacterium]
MLDPQQRVGPYEVRSVVGRGGMGSVYLAVDLRLGRRVALKVLDRAAAGGHDAMLAEARLTARVSHPAIVAVYDVGELDGRPWLALEFVDGRPLAAWVAEGPTPALQAARLLQPVAEALAAAHAAGIVHRDLKPDNILVGRDGRPRVVDFGIAQGASEGAAGVAGTPGYMAPEVWRGEPATAAADVWALGVTLYELLAGRSPWQAAIERGVAAVRAQVASQAEAPQLPDPGDVPPALVALVEACLDPVAARRPAASQVAHDLGRVLTRVPVDTEACPFPGLLPYTAEHAGWFFGRDVEVSRLERALDDHARVAVTGPSGVGKSSLVLAGVVPRLQERGAVVVVALRPGAMPVHALARAVQPKLHTLEVTGGSYPSETVSMDTAAWDEPVDPAAAPVDLEGGAVDGGRVGALEAELRAAPGRLAVLLQRLAEARGARVVVVVDQLEELETQGASDADRRVFVDALAAAAVLPSDRVRVVVTLRDDHLGRVAFAGAQPLLDHLEVVGPLDPAALGGVLRASVAVAGHRFAPPTLVDTIVADVAATPGALPLLQFALRRLWDLRDVDRRELRASDYAALGGVAGALAGHAEAIVRRWTAEGHAQGEGSAALDTLRAILLRLVHDDGTRRVVGLEALVEGLEPADGARAVRERLVSGRLLVVRDEEGGHPVVELAHESLAESWDRLRRWRMASRDEVRLVADLEEAARLWERRGRLDEGLWGGDTLGLAERVLSHGVVGLSDRGRRFFEASSSHARLDRVRRRRRLAALGIAGLVVTVGSVAAAVAYDGQRDRALREAEAASHARATALVSSAEAAWSAGDRLAARARLRSGFEETDSVAARALWSALRADVRLWHQDDPFSSFQIQPTPDGAHAVIASAGGLLRVVALDTAATRSLRVGAVDVAAAALRADLGVAVGLRYDGSMVVWDLGRDTWSEAPLLPPGELPVRAWFTGDGALVVFTLTQEDRAAAVWSVALDQPEAARRVALPAGHGFAEVDATGRSLWTGGPDADHLTRWSLADGLVADGVVPLPDGVRAEAIAVDRGGDRVAVFGERPTLLTGDGQVLVALVPPAQRVRGGGFVGDGERLAALTTAGDLVSWSTRTGAAGPAARAATDAATLQQVVGSTGDRILYTHLYGYGVLDARGLRDAPVAQGHTGRADGLAVSPDGAWVASGASDARVVLRDAATGQVRAEAGPFSGSVNAVRFAPSGAFLAVAPNGGEAVVVAVPTLEVAVRVPHDDDVVAAELLDDHTLRALTWSGTLRDTVWVDGVPATASEFSLGSEAYDLRRASDGTTWVALTDGRVAPWTPAGQLGPAVLHHTSPPHSLGLGGGRVAAAGFDDRVRVSTPPVTLPATTDGRIALSPSGQWLAYPAAGGRLLLRDLDAGAERSLLTPGLPVDAVAFSPDGGTVYGASRGGTVSAWETATGRPQWRGIALTADPPRALTHRGWEALGAGPPLPSDAGSLAGDGYRADLDGAAACLLSVDGAVARGGPDGGAASVLAQRPGATDVALLGTGCAVLDPTGLTWVGPGGASVALAPARGAWRLGSTVFALDGDHLRAWTAPTSELPAVRVSPDATVAVHVGSALCAGFDDGQVLCEGGPSLRTATSSAVTQAVPYGADGVALGFGDGEVGIWSTRTGARLLGGKLDGAVVRLVVADGALLALTATGSALALDTDVLVAPWCAVLDEVTRQVPVVWEDERLAMASGRRGPCAPP